MKEAIKSSLRLEIEIERAHRVDKRKKVGAKQHSKEEKEKPRTIVCKLKDWKQRESVTREARKNQKVSTLLKILQGQPNPRGRNRSRR